MSEKIKVIKKIFAANEKIAEENAAVLEENQVFTVNIMGSPGSGKTSLIENTTLNLKDKLKIAVIEGDIQGSLDAERLNRLNVEVVQINTGGACHLNSSMIQSALSSLNLKTIDLLFIENVGNLVCPAEFLLGERLRIMTLSLTEGEDKPQKYPLMFTKCEALVLNKMDLAPFLSVNPEIIKKEAQKINPKLEIFPVSCTRGDGIKEFSEWLKKKISTL
jgi:hydrogenase nickel incorporation protein HypB